MHSLRNLSLSLLTILALVLSACGGGGGGEDGNTGGVTPPGADLPAITDVNPAPGRNDVDRDTLIEITFGAALDVAALPANALSLRDDDGSVTGSYSYDAARQSLVFSPTNPLKRDMPHVATLAAGIRDIDGNERPNPFLFAFRTAPLVTGAAAPHEQEIEDAQLRGFAVNSQGEGASLMSVDFGNRTDIVLRTLTSNGEFGAAIDVDSFVGSVSADTNASVAVDSSGKGIAAWRVNGPNGPDVYAVTFDAVAGTHGATHTLDATDETSDRPQVVMSVNGQGLVVWTGLANTGSREVRAAYFDPANGWSPSVSLEPSNLDASGAKVSIRRTGDYGMVAWTLQNGSDTISRARPFINGSFGTVHTIHQVTNGQSRVEKALTLNSGESMVVTSYANTPTPNFRGIRTKRYRTSNLSNPGWQSLAQPTLEAGAELKVDAALISGVRVILAYGVDTSTGPLLEAREYTMAGTWSAPIVVTNLMPDTFAGNWMRIASRNDRYTLIDWTFQSGASRTRRATLLHNGTPVYTDLAVPAKANSGRAVLTIQGAARYVTRVGGTSGALETVIVDPTGVPGAVERVDGGTHEFISDYRFDMSGNGRGAILWSGRPGPAGTPFDVLHAIID